MYLCVCLSLSESFLNFGTMILRINSFDVIVLYILIHPPNSLRYMSPFTARVAFLGAG
jgi:hypothetical protein